MLTRKAEIFYLSRAGSSEDSINLRETLQELRQEHQIKIQEIIKRSIQIAIAKHNAKQGAALK